MRKLGVIAAGCVIAFVILLHFKYVGEGTQSSDREVPSVCEGGGDVNMCLTDKALREGDAGYCSRINVSDEVDSCHYSLALRQNNDTLCTLIRSDTSRYRCLATLMKEPAICGRIGETKARDSCYATLALRTVKVEVCHNITTVVIRDKCLFDLTEKKPNAPECFNIVNQTLKDSCVYEHVRMNLINPQLCYHVKDPELQKNCSEVKRVVINKSSGGA